MTKKQLAKNIATSGIETIISIVPVIGSPVQTALSSFISDRRFYNLELFVNDLADQLNAVKTRLPETNAVSLDVIEIVETVYEEAEKTRQKEKRTLFIKALTNSFLRNDNDDLKKEKFFINILSVMPFEYMNRLLIEVDYFKYKDKEPFSNQAFNMNANVGAKSFLEGYSLLHTETTGMNVYGNDLTPKTRTRITSLGSEFVAFVMSIDDDGINNQ